MIYFIYLYSWFFFQLRQNKLYEFPRCESNFQLKGDFLVYGYICKDPANIREGDDYLRIVKYDLIKKGVSDEKVPFWCQDGHD